MMRVLETSVIGKLSSAKDCEDQLALGRDHIAVIDGATDKTGIRYDGVPGGRFAAGLLAEAVASLPADIDALGAAKRLTEALATALAETGVRDDDAPSAVIAIYSRHWDEVWRIGDCGIRMGSRIEPATRLVDQVAARARAALLRALLRSGADLETLRTDDPGREMIMPLLRAQHRFRNLDDDGELFAFGAIDGTRIPDRFIEVFDVSGCESLVLASDGYPEPSPTLSEAEASVVELLEDDPLCISKHVSTKGAYAGAVSFDDRAYVRLVRSGIS